MFISTRNRATVGSCALLISCCLIRGAEADEMESDSLASVVVTATRSERSIDEVPESVSVVTSQAIADTPGQALDDILRRSPSVDLPNATSYQLHPAAGGGAGRGRGGGRARGRRGGGPMN